MSNGREDLEELTCLAGEYVLGLLDDATRARFEDRMAADAELRGLVASERERFLELDLTATGSALKDDMWQSIERRVGDRPADIVNLAARREVRSPTYSRRSFWQGFAAASVVAAIGASIAYTRIVAPAPRLIVVLLDDQAQPVSIVETLGDERVRIVPLTALEVSANQSLQVWTLPDPATGPVSLGLLGRSRSTLLDGPSLPPPKPNQLYEITLEPAGGSPTGRPTGRIIGKGFARVPQI